MSQDSVYVGTVEVSDQVFERANALTRHVGFSSREYDTVLALSRETVRRPSSTLQIKSSFQLMIEQAALERNVFTLRLPGTDGSTGRLTLGWVDERLSKGKAVARLPLIDS